MDRATKAFEWYLTELGLLISYVPNKSPKNARVCG